MKRYNVITLLILFFGACRESEVNTKPNIILIVADDLGYGDLGAYGCTDIETPNIDQLASEGVKFTNFYANGPECTPTRAALLSGGYQQRIGGLECAIGSGNVGRYPEAEWLSGQNELGMPGEYLVLPRLLKENGYKTAVIGKWHLGYEPKFRPDRHWFDYSFGPLGYGGDYFYHVELDPIGHKDFTGKHTLQKNGKEIFRDGEYITDLITQNAIEWIDQLDNDTPYFLYLPYTSPHDPLQGPDDDLGRPLTPEEWKSLKGREDYIPLVESLDNNLGKLFEFIDQHDPGRETFIIFFSDNGGTHHSANNGPFKGSKGQVYEGGIRVPCIVKWENNIAGNTISNQPCISFDLTKSILSAAGIHDTDSLDGIDILNHVMHNKPDFDRVLFWRKKRGDRVFKAIRNGDMKYIINYEGDLIMEEGLYNLEKDSIESVNLLITSPEIVEQMRKKINTWEREIRAPRLENYHETAN